MATPTRLETGDRLPPLTAETAGGGAMTIPDDLAGDWAAVVFYRGHF